MAPWHVAVPGFRRVARACRTSTVHAQCTYSARTVHAHSAQARNAANTTENGPYTSKQRKNWFQFFLMIACNFNGLRAIYTIWCACTAACTVACTVRALCVHCQNTRICILSPLLSFLLSLYTLLPPWRACVPVGTLL